MCESCEWQRFSFFERSEGILLMLLIFASSSKINFLEVLSVSLVLEIKFTLRLTAAKGERSLAMLVGTGRKVRGFFSLPSEYLNSDGISRFFPLWHSDCAAFFSEVFKSVLPHSESESELLSKFSGISSSKMLLQTSTKRKCCINIKLKLNQHSCWPIVAEFTKSIFISKFGTEMSNKFFCFPTGSLNVGRGVTTVLASTTTWSQTVLSAFVESTFSCWLFSKTSFDSIFEVISSKELFSARSNTIL